jgi:AcrR family transcriptional regulator
MTKAAVRERKVDVDRVLQAAARLFRDQGYAATSLRDVARAAGMLPGSLHYRYATKEDILSALMERAIDRLIEGVLSAAAAGTDPLDRMRLAIVAHVKILLSGEDSVYVLLYDWRSLSPAAERAIAKQRKRYEQFADELLAQAAAYAPVLPGVDLYLVRQFGFGAANWVAQWYDPKGPYTPEQIADHFFRYLSQGTLKEG